MTSPNFIFVICSAGGHVGKTTMARLIGDHFVLSGRRFAGFDTDPYEPEFANRFPRDVVLVKPNSVASQMTLFDGLLADDGIPKIVDLWHHAISPFFNLWNHISFDAEARRIGIVPILIFFAEPSQRSLAVANNIFAHHPHSLVVTAYNEGAQTTSMIDRETLARFPAGPTFRMPEIDPILRNIIDARGFSFSRFMLAPPIGMSIVLRATLKSWILLMHKQFQTLELSLAMESAEFSS